ncbi:MAG: ABC transporter substrate-binding protein [Henriciella sp.]
MFRLTLLLGLFVLAACGQPNAVSPVSYDRPMRIVSLDYCADQYVLKFADPDQILAISPDAVADFSYMRDHADGIRTVRPTAEDVLVLKPDLIVRSYGGGPNATAFFERAGVPVLQVGWVNQVVGTEDGSVSALVQSMADGLGQSEKGQVVVEEFQLRLSELQSQASGIQTLYMTGAGVSSGSGTLMHEMLTAAGLKNYSGAVGWHSLPLEQMVYAPPEMIAASFFKTADDARYRWSASRHPIAMTQFERANTVSIDGAWTACGGWFILEAIEALSAGAARVD